MTSTPALLSLDEVIALIDNFMKDHGFVQENRPTLRTRAFHRGYNHPCGWFVSISDNEHTTTLYVGDSSSSNKTFRKRRMADRLQDAYDYLTNNWADLKKAYNARVDQTRACHNTQKIAKALRQEFSDIVTPEQHVSLTTEKTELLLSFATKDPDALRKLLLLMRQALLTP